MSVLTCDTTPAIASAFPITSSAGRPSADTSPCTVAPTSSIARFHKLATIPPTNPSAPPPSKSGDSRSMLNRAAIWCVKNPLINEHTWLT